MQDKKETCSVWHSRHLSRHSPLPLPLHPEVPCSSVSPWSCCCCWGCLPSSPPLPFYPPATSAPTRCLLSRELLLCLSSLSLGPPIAFLTLSHPLLWPLVSLLVHLPFSLSPLQKCGLFLLDACYCKPLCLVSSNICSGAWPVAQSGKHSILPGL